MTVTRPERCAVGTAIVPARTRGIVTSPNVRSIGVSAAEADAARASAATGTKSTNLRRKAYRLATT
jgi:hypothetical protein